MVPVEDVVVSHDNHKIQILPSASLATNTWIRPIGCDIPAGSVVLSKGDVIDPVALGLIKQSGADYVSVKRPLVVGVLSTGNELIVDKNDKEQSGMIPDVNRPILLHLISSFGDYCRPVDLGNQRDDSVEDLASTIDKALERCDVIITTGGVSMGESDIVKRVLVDHCGGTLHFGRMHMKPGKCVEHPGVAVDFEACSRLYHQPGKPTTFVTIPKGDKLRLVFGMPGNPVSATVCTQLLVRPCLDLLYHASCSEWMELSEDALNEMVENALVHEEINAMLTHDIVLDAERPEYHRVTVHKQQDGSFGVSTTGNQRSSRLLSCRGAQALVVLPVGSSIKPKALKGEFYPVLLLGSLRGFNQLLCKNSKHLAKQGRQYHVAVIEVFPENQAKLSVLDETCMRVASALSGSKSGSAKIVCRKTFSAHLDFLYTEIADTNDADLVVVSCVSFDGAFPFHLDVATAIQRGITKPAKALALQARQGAASENATAALFEVVAGFAPEKQGAMVVCLPDIGVSGGLSNVRGLLKHSLNVARGKPHNDHHSHSHRDHGKRQ